MIEEGPRERIERLVAEGRLSPEQVARAEVLWRDQWQGGLPMPNGEVIRITQEDLYHLIVDDRIARKPGRLELILLNVYEIREVRAGRRRALSRWQEDDEVRHAFGTLAGDRLRTAHLIDERDLRKYRNEGLLWRR